MEECLRRCMTAMLILIWVSMGFYLEIGGPTLIDLRIKLNATSEDIARCISAQGFGSFLGAVIGGVFVDVFGQWKFLLVTASAVLASASLITMAFVKNLTLLWVMFFLLGSSAGLSNVVGQRMLLEMWREKAPSPMHALHMGFGIGALAAPLIVNPFLAVLRFHTHDTFVNRTMSPATSDIHEDFVVIEESRVHLAYITIAAITTLLSSPLIVYPFVKCRRRKPRVQYSNMDSDTESVTDSTRYRCIDTINPASYADGSFKFGVFMFVMVFLYFLNTVGAEQMFGNFARTFSVDELEFSRDAASYLDTVYWGTFTLGRFTGSVLAHFLTIRTLFLADMVLNLMAITFADIYATSNKATLWAFTAIVGFFIGPLFPACISYANTQIEMGGVVLTLIIVASGLGQMLYVWIEGALYDTYGPRTILYVMQVSAVLVSAIILLLVITTFRRGDRFKRVVQGLLENEDISNSVRYTQVDQSSTQSEDNN